MSQSHKEPKILAEKTQKLEKIVEMEEVKNKALVEWIKKHEAALAKLIIKVEEISDKITKREGSGEKETISGL